MPATIPPLGARLSLLTQTRFSRPSSCTRSRLGAFSFCISSTVMAEHSQQPDIDALAQGLQVASTEARKISNLPHFQQGNNILQSIANLNQQMQAMQQQMQAMQQQMQAMQQQMEIRFDGIERRLDASEHNNIARLHNASPLQLSEPLIPIHDRYNQPINGFPTTIHQIDNMTSHQLSEVLEYLDQNTHGNVNQRRTRLKQAIGIYQQRTG